MAENVTLIGRILQKYNLITPQLFDEAVKAHGQLAGRVPLSDVLRDKGHLTKEQVAWLSQAIRHYEAQTARTQADKAHRGGHRGGGGGQAIAEHAAQRAGMEISALMLVPAPMGPGEGAAPPRDVPATVAADEPSGRTPLDAAAAVGEPSQDTDGPALDLELDPAELLAEPELEAAAPPDPAAEAEPQRRTTEPPRPVTSAEGPAPRAVQDSRPATAIGRVAIGALRTEKRRLREGGVLEPVPAPVAPVLETTSPLELPRLLQEALRLAASDLHLHVGAPPLLRVSGELVPLQGHRALTAEGTEQLLAQALSPEQRRRLADEGDVSFSYQAPALCRARGAALRQQRGCDLVLRVLPARVPTTSELQVPEALIQLCDARAGLLVCAGPAGSGKSWTMGALVDQLALVRARRGDILVIEDPIEQVHAQRGAAVQQRQVERQRVVRALAAAASECFDVIAIDEPADAEALAMVLHCAGSSLVLCTLRAGSAAGAIEHMLSRFAAERAPAARALIAQTLLGVSCQRLLRRADGRGLVAAREVLVCTPAVAALIERDRTAGLRAEMREGRELGMCLLDESVQKLCKSGAISPPEALKQPQVTGLAL